MSSNLVLSDLGSKSGYRSANGSCLPPRKRLLAGLKKNMWSSCSDSYAAAWNSIGAPCEGLMEDLKLEVDLQDSKSGDESSPGGCCHTQQAEPIGNTVQGEINAVVVSTPCRKFQHFRDAAVPPNQFVDHNHSKKVRVVAKERSPNSENLLQKIVNCVPVSYKENLAAERLAIEKAAKNAEEAKTVAAEKAAIAVKAALTARAALELVMRTTHKERLRAKNHPHSKMGDIESKQDSECTEAKLSQTSPQVDDEELALQLHRAINSSPRISRAFSPKGDGSVPIPGQSCCQIRSYQTQLTKNVETIPKRTNSVKPDMKMKSVSAINQTLNFQEAGLAMHNTTSEMVASQFQVQKKDFKTHKIEFSACPSSKAYTDGETEISRKCNEVSVACSARDAKLGMDQSAALVSKDVTRSGRKIQWKRRDGSSQIGWHARREDTLHRGMEAGPLKSLDFHADYCNYINDNNANSSAEGASKNKGKVQESKQTHPAQEHKQLSEVFESKQSFEVDRNLPSLFFRPPPESAFANGSVVRHTCKKKT